MTPPAPAVDLKRHLAVRVTVVALLICACACAAVFHQAGLRIAEHVGRSGATIERLIGNELAARRDFVHRGIEDLQLVLLEQLGASLRLCVQVRDLTGREVLRRCFADGSEAHTLTRAGLARLPGAGAVYRGAIVQYPGIKVGEFEVRPDLRAEAAAVAMELQRVLVITAGVLLLNVLIYLPVRRALVPTEQVLATIARLRTGDLAARMPRPRLVELRRIAEGFDELAARLQATDARQRQLARSLLTVREEERRRLARELHDEFGQSLASVRAEAALGVALAGGIVPAVLAPLQAIARNAGEMMENLQRILQQLRPLGLESAGLRAAVAQLLADASRQRPGCRTRLEMPEGVDALDEQITISLYRIVQESITNALRHGRPESLSVSLRRQGARLLLIIEDDGSPGVKEAEGSGMGVLGMRERVQALGGRFALVPRAPRGMRVAVDIPLAAGEWQGGDDGDDSPAAGR